MRRASPSAWAGLSWTRRPARSMPSCRIPAEGSRSGTSDRATMAAHRGTSPHSFLNGLRQVLSHGAVTILAVAIAFSLPGFANYILNEWWPEVESNANLLLATEIALASVLALVFNMATIAWDHRQRVLTARLASLEIGRAHV